MQQESSEQENEGSPRSSYFEGRSASELTGAFAGQLEKNIAGIEKSFGVKLLSRDTWIKMEADTEEALNRAKGLIQHLFRLQKESGLPLSQADFDLALTAFLEGGDAQVQQFFSKKITVSAKHPPIVPRTRNQLIYADALENTDLVFALGPAGTGKTYLAVAMAVNALLTGKRDRIVLTRPAVEAGENLGFLPGKLEDKINPYLRPLYDALRDMLGAAELAAMTEKGTIEIAPLAFMRGRTLNNSFIILDEAQNTTDDQMLMFLTRLGFHSQCVVAGDPTQTDLPGRVRSGLVKAVKLLSPIREIKICRFGKSDVLRHSLVEKIVSAYENDGEQEP